MKLFLDRPLIVFDLETTGVDVAKDRIVTMAGKKYFADALMTVETFDLKFNPGIPIPAEASAVNGIFDTDVQDCPKFKAEAAKVHDLFKDCDLAGFNCIYFDVPLLWEEFARCGINWNLDGVKILDAKNIFFKKEPRNLIAARKFYCGKEHAEAHNALADVEATAEVLFAQLDRYEDLGAMNLKQVAEFSRMDNRIDLAGKFIRNEQGEAIYNFGKHKGTRVKDELGFAAWMRGKDFTSNTLMHVERMLKEFKGGL